MTKLVTWLIFTFGAPLMSAVPDCPCPSACCETCLPECCPPECCPPGCSRR